MQKFLGKISAFIMQVNKVAGQTICRWYTKTENVSEICVLYGRSRSNMRKTTWEHNTRIWD